MSHLARLLLFWIWISQSDCSTQDAHIPAGTVYVVQCFYQPCRNSKRTLSPLHRSASMSDEGGCQAQHNDTTKRWLSLNKRDSESTYHCVWFSGGSITQCKELDYIIWIRSKLMELKWSDAKRTWKPKKKTSCGADAQLRTALCRWLTNRLVTSNIQTEKCDESQKQEREIVMWSLIHSSVSRLNECDKKTKIKIKENKPHSKMLTCELLCQDRTR